MAKVKFKDLSKKDKIFKSINLTLMAILAVVIVGLTIYFWVVGDPRNRVPAGFTMLFAVLAPWLFELIFRTRVPNVLFIGIEIYLIIAGIWGSLLSGYNDFVWLDIVVHVIMGYLCAMLGIFVISRTTDYNKLKPFAIILFCFFFSLGIELIWELGEWFADLFVGQTAQGPKIDGFGVPLVTDTMEDILCNFSGSLAFIIHYCIGKFSKCSLGIKTIENELAKGYKVGEVVNQNSSNQISTEKQKDNSQQIFDVPDEIEEIVQREIDNMKKTKSSKSKGKLDNKKRD